jgi:hypothetical protein
MAAQFLYCQVKSSRGEALSVDDCNGARVFPADTCKKSKNFAHWIRPARRTNPRAKLGRKLRVRPSDGNEEDFEEIATSVNLSKRGMYFHSDLPGYRVGLRLFVTYPFTSVSDPMKTEWIAEVMRVDEIPGNKRVSQSVYTIEFKWARLTVAKLKVLIPKRS